MVFPNYTLSIPFLFFFFFSSTSPSLLFNTSLLPGIALPTHLTFNSVTAPAGSPCNHHHQKPTKISNTLKLHLTHQTPTTHPSNSAADHYLLSAVKDLSRIQTLFHRIAHKNPQIPTSPNLSNLTAATHPYLAGRLVATLESGVSAGSGEYFMDVFIGTPPTHFSLILDTGSDLNWVQCAPCHDCFPQRGQIFNPNSSTSYKHLTCDDPRCRLVSPPTTAKPCAAGDPCPYFYWYGDKSNTTGDLAVETFTVNLTSTGQQPESHQVKEVIFGCGHWNRGLFHGAAGLLGLGRGPLSFSSQLRSLYGHAFSYCLVDRNSNSSVSSKLIFGEDQDLIAHPKLNYTSFMAGKDSLTDTFYYVQVKGIRVGGELVQVPKETFQLAKDGNGGTIIDSGTTLSYFADPAYGLIREAFVKKVKYPLVEDFPVLNPCYNVSGVEGEVRMPEFSIVFEDGAVWDFPVENYFIRLEPEEIMCLAILGMPRSSLSIIGNYQQQNFHILYDTERSRLGFAPMKCAEV